MKVIVSLVMILTLLAQTALAPAVEIQFKNGNAANLPATLPTATPAWTNDAPALYVGTGTGKVKVGPLTAGEVGADPAGSSAAVASQLTGKEDKANKGQVNGYAGLNGAGVVPAAQLPIGVTAGTVAAGNDARLSDPRAPLAHEHDAGNVTTGTIDGDRLPAMSASKKGAVPPTGTPAGKYLKDDGTWAIPPVGTGGTADHSALSNLSYEQSGHTGFATEAQGAKADTALQPAGSGSQLTGVVNSFHYQASDFTGNPILADSTYNRRDPSRIIKVGSTYYVYYTKALNIPVIPGAQIWYATAPAITGPWTEQGIALDMGSAGAWDSNAVYTPDIIASGGTYYLFYVGQSTAYAPFVHAEIGVATSNSPAGPFVKSGSPILSYGSAGSWEDILVDAPYPVQLGDGTWRMYYKGRSSSARRIGFATAPGISGPWTKYPGNPTWGKGVTGAPDADVENGEVVIMNNRYYMMTQTMVSGTVVETRDWWESTDGISGWVKTAAIESVDSSRRAGAWDAYESMGAKVAPLEGELSYILTNGAPDASSKIGLGIFTLARTAGDKPTIKGLTDSAAVDKSPSVIINGTKNGVRFGMLTGTAPYNIPQLDASGKLPAVDGSNLTGVATAAQGAKADTALQPTGSGAQLTGITAAQVGAATYTVAPYGATYAATYTCTATDCGPAFQAAFDAAKASGKKGKILAGEGLFPFTSTVNAADADSIIVEGVAPAGMWGTGGTVFSLDANVEMFNFGRVSQTARANVFKNIHFKGNSRPYAMIHSVNGFNFEVDHNYFELCMPCIIAERPWDWKVSFNNYRSCGSGNTATTAAVVLANATVASDGGQVGDNGSGWHQQFDRFETRPGTSIFVQPSATYTMNVATFLGNKFEGVAGAAYPAIYGSLADSRIALNSCYYSDSSCFNIDSASYSNEIANNYCSATAGTDIVVNGDDNIVAENTFNYPVDGATAHITVASGADGTVVSNNHKASADSTPLFINNGTNTDLDSLVTLTDWPAGLTPTELGYLDGVTSSVQAQLNSKAETSAIPGNATGSTAGTVTVSGTTTKAASVSGTLTQGKQATFDASGNLIASSFDTGVAGGGSVSWGNIGGTLASQTDLNTALNDKQATLVNQTNIKSVNGFSLLGSGDLTIGGMVYPGDGVPVASSGAWGTSLGYGFGANQLLQLNSVGNIFLKATNGTNTQLNLQARNGSGTIVSDWIFSATTTPQLTIYDAVNSHNVFAFTPGAPENSLFMDSTGAVGLGTNTPAGQLDVSKQGASAQITATVLSGGSPTFLGRESGWTASAPAPTPSGSTLLFVGGQGYDDAPGWASTASVAMVGKANQAFTTAGRGGYLAFQTTADNSTSRTEKVRMHGSGGVSFGSTTDPGAGSLLMTGNLSVAGTTTAPIIKPAADSTTAVQITKANGTTPVIVADTTNGQVGINTTPVAKLHVYSDSTTATPLMVDQVGDNGSPAIVARKARGTTGAMTQVTANTVLFAFGGRPWFSDTQAWATSNYAGVFGVAGENVDSTHHGAYLSLRTTASGVGGGTGNSMTEQAVIHGSGCFSVGNSTDCGTGNINATNNVTAKILAPTIQAAATDGATVTFDLALGQHPSVVLGGNRTLAFTNPQVGASYRLRLIQDATGNRVPVWPTTGFVCTFVKMDGTRTTTAPTPHSAANSEDTVIIIPTSSTAGDCYARGY